MTIEQKQVVVPGASRGDYLINTIATALHRVVRTADSDRHRLRMRGPDAKLGAGIIQRPRAERPLPRVRLVHSGTSQIAASGGSVTSAE